MSEKKALVVISFGTSMPNARKHLTDAEKFIAQKHSDRDCFTAYTSNIIRKKLNGQGENILSPTEVIEKLIADGYKDVFIVPTHIIPGEEYEKICVLEEKYADKFESFVIAKPLIHDPESLQSAAEVLSNIYKVTDNTALVFMGHGTEHLSNFIYPALQTALNLKGKKNVFVATVEGWPTLDDVINQMHASGFENVALAPIMMVAGDHVQNDMMGPEEDSWKNILVTNGFIVDCFAKGLCEFEEVLNLLG